MIDLLVAGTDTSAVTSQWILYLLAKHPEAQKVFWVVRVAIIKELSFSRCCFVAMRICMCGWCYFCFVPKWNLSSKGVVDFFVDSASRPNRFFFELRNCERKSVKFLQTKRNITTLTLTLTQKATIIYKQPNSTVWRILTTCKERHSGATQQLPFPFHMNARRILSWMDISFQKE